jgi:general secretion pathway protein G
MRRTLFSIKTISCLENSRKRAFTLIELIFVIVIIGLLASISVPKFMTTKSSASSTSAKAIVSSLRTSIETKHGEWLIDDTLDSTNGYSNKGYPSSLDDIDGQSNNGDKLFNKIVNSTPILKTPIISCSATEGTDCWYKESNDSTVSYYRYKLSDSENLRIDYNNSSGKIECQDGDNITKTQCESIIN